MALDQKVVSNSKNSVGAPQAGQGDIAVEILYLGGRWELREQSMIIWSVLELYRSIHAVLAPSEQKNRATESRDIFVYTAGIYGPWEDHLIFFSEIPI